MDRFYTAKAPISENKTYHTGELRFSVITNRILRVERDPGFLFEDRATQKIMHRDFGEASFEVSEDDISVIIKTEEAEFYVNKDTLKVEVKMVSYTVDADCVHYLGGTFRTLDNALGDRIKFGENKGRVKLSDSIFSLEGVAVIDDSGSYLLEEDGTLAERAEGVVDKYILAFGKDYLGGLKEFYHLTGFTPLLPKYALGNWWSRYYAYRQQEYLDLMDKFADKKIPLTVATIDMDWHLVKNVPKDAKTKYKFWGKGWTGYTFDKELFPDYKQFFKDLKERNLAITMNLHPHDGIRYFEDQYEQMAKANGIDPATKEGVEFDFTNRTFVDSYFDYVMHPYEEDGVDFWWIDWQQGKKSGKKGLDPLWLLNHYHTLDAGRNGRTPLILSRYSGTGSHRYPLGFSGDTIVRWQSLAYQPYFTTMSSNTGYSWWSHDIGGHMFSKGNPEIYTRWVEYGVFSPINRLHSTRDKWSKEPWLYGPQAEEIVTRFLQLRHRLLPYLYTANVLTATEGIPLIMPMYYLNDCKEAYEAKNQYYFGENMIVAPVLQPVDQKGVAPVSVWLPEGIWTDFFTREVYEGGQTYELSVPMDRIPVFVKAGAVVPLLMNGESNHQDFTSLEVCFYAGEGTYRMYDEIGYIDFAVTSDGDKMKISIEPSEDCATKEIKITALGAASYDVSHNGAIQII
ncbi:MAG: glycoside hydrolase family 31 protein [Lachnospiraceae bacterium]|nr:glycoside hydrolase family 31 protein [Lachnospiraceae bacterium]